MAGHQRILVVSAAADDAEVRPLRPGLGRDPVVLVAPTAEADRVARALGHAPRAEALLAPVSFPDADRGHRLDGLVRRHALVDRYRDVVVVTDPASAILLLRVLAPDQLPTGGAVTVVGLPRGDRPVDVRRAVLAGVALGVTAGLAGAVAPLPALPATAAGLGVLLLAVPPWRHLGRELLLAAGIAVLVLFAAIVSSTRFPGSW